MIPKRRKRPKMMAPKESAPIHCPAHLKWVRGFDCCVASKRGIGPLGTPVGGHECSGKVHAHHVRSVGAGGGDEQVVPVCALAHDNIHRGFCYDIDLASTAAELWKHSPAGARYRLENTTQQKRNYT